MLNGIWPIVLAALGELLGMSLFSAGFWMINDLRGELLGRDAEAEHQDMLHPGMWCLVPGLALALGMFAVQFLAAFIVMFAVLAADLTIVLVLLRRKSARTQQEIAALQRQLDDEDDPAG